MRKEGHAPLLIVIAGPNGSGKTKITSEVLASEWLEDAVYINPDIVAQEKFGDWNSPEAVREAALYCEQWRERCLADGIARRVMKGGHDVPIPKIISRYIKSIANCAEIAPEVDRLYVYDNSLEDVKAQPLFRLRDGDLGKQYVESVPEWTKNILPK